MDKVQASFSKVNRLINRLTSKVDLLEKKVALIEATPAKPHVTISPWEIASLAARVEALEQRGFIATLKRWFKC